MRENAIPVICYLVHPLLHFLVASVGRIAEVEKVFFQLLLLGFASAPKTGVLQVVDAVLSTVRSAELDYALPGMQDACYCYIPRHPSVGVAQPRAHLQLHSHPAVLEVVACEEVQ